MDASLNGRDVEQLSFRALLPPIKPAFPPVDRFGDGSRFRYNL